MFQDLCRIYSDVDSGDLGTRQLFDIKDKLKAVRPQEIQSESEAKSFINLLRKFREAIAENDKLHGENYPDLLSSLLSVGENGLYSNNLRFIFELIQNVDDCDFADPQDCRLDIQFDFNNEQIILTYNEVGFTPFNVFAITGIAEAAKNISAEKNEIGEKGIGFKSVFGVADRVWIKSGWFSFVLHKDNFTIPIENYDSFQYQPGTRMILYVGEKSREIYDQIKNQYCRKDAIFSRNPILFLNKLTSLRMYYDAWRSMEFDVSRSSTDHQSGIVCENNVVISVELHDHDQTTDLNVDKKEIVCSRYSSSVVYSEKACRSRYGDDTKVGSGGGKHMRLQVIIPQPQFISEVGAGALYSFLPTQLKLTVPMVCHVPFKLDASREFVDSQKNNKWFEESVYYLSVLMDSVYLDWCKSVKQEIVSYLPAWNSSLFAKNNGDELCLSNNACFTGKHFSQLPLFYAVDKTYKKASDVFVFRQENIIEPETVYQLLNRQDTLFDVSDPGTATRIGIESVDNAYDKLFKRALHDPKTTDKALSLLTRAKYHGFYEVLSVCSKVDLTADQIECVFKYKDVKDAFLNEAGNRISKNMRPVFQVRNADLVDLRDLLFDEFVIDDTPTVVKSYLNYCSEKCVCLNIGDNEFLPCNNGIILSESNPLSSMAAFCYSMDQQDTFSIRVRLREASERLNRYTENDSVSAEEFLRVLKSIRQLVKESLGRRGYDNYIKLILRSGTDEKRFIQELIQNADDCEYEDGAVPTFSLFHKGNTIVTEYNEKGFTRDNIRSITAIGESTKNSLLNGESETIGKKGVGFKTIFAIASEVRIFSGDYQFFLTDREPTIPKLMGTKCAPVKGTRMEVALKGKDVFLIKDSKDLLKLCLCLRKLKELKIGGHSVSIDDTETSRRITVDGKAHVFKRYIHEFKIDEQIAKEKDQFGYRTYSSRQKIVCYVPEKKESIDYFIYNGLPTRHKLNIQMAIDAPFELTTSREEIEIDRAEWNDRILFEFYRAIVGCMLELRSRDRIQVLRFTRFLMRRFGNVSVYVNSISDSDYITAFDYKGLLKGAPIIPTFDHEVFVIPEDNVAYRYPEIARYIFTNKDYGNILPQSIIDEDAEFEAALNALECKGADFSDVFALIEKYAETYIENSEFRELLYPYLQQATEEYYDRIAGLAIIPVFGTRRGVTEYHSYDDLDGELFVKKGASISLDYYVLNESILPKSICEDILGVNINEMNDEYERARYKENLQQILKRSDIESAYRYLLAEYRSGNIERYHAADILRANVEIVPLKNQSGDITDDELFICDQPEGYFPIEMLQSITVAEECKKLAEEMKCRHLKDIHYEDIRYDEMLTADDIECLTDTYFLHSDEIIRSFKKDGLISDELWNNYDLGYLSIGISTSIAQDYEFPEDPVVYPAQLKASLKKQMQNPVEVVSVVRQRKVFVGKRNSGEEFDLGIADARLGALRTYNPDPQEDICFCQMCKTPKNNVLIEVNNIELKPKFFFPQLRVALCLECSKRFEMLRSNQKIREEFHDRIRKASILGKGIVEIPIFGDSSITFTAKHLAEIQEIMSSELYK